MQSGTLLNSAWSHAAAAGMTVNGFRAVGAFPLNPDSVPEHAFSVSNLQKAQAQSVNNDQMESKTSNTEKEKTAPSPSIIINAMSQDAPNIIRETQLSPLAEFDFTPGKMLQEISPIPILSTATKRRKPSAAHLTSPRYIENKKISKLNPKRTKCQPVSLYLKN